MAESVVSSVRALRAALVAFQPDGCSGEDCAVLVEELAALEKVSAAARVRAAARAGACGAHRERGFADVSDWVARATGSTAGSAKAALETAAALEAQPEAKAALDAGELSFAQARELVKTEAAVPGSTIGLLEVAKGQSLRTLKDQARDRRLRAIDPEELHAMQHAAMHHRHWTTALGTIAYSGELPPEIGIPFINRLDAETDRLWLKAHQTANQQTGNPQPESADCAANIGNQLRLSTGAGTDQSCTNDSGAADSSVGDSGVGDSGVGGSGPGGSDARGSRHGGSRHGGSGNGGSGNGGSGNGGSGTGGSGVGGSGAGGSGAGGCRAAKAVVRRSVLAAQAFVRMIENGGVKGKAGRADLVIVCDLNAYRRGHAHEGEACHIVGGGPIPVSLVKELGRDAFLKAVLHNGTEIHTIAHFGRRYPAVLRTALDLGAPPEFNGNVCAAPGCDRRYHLQMDHIDPLANGGLTSYDNNQPLCPPDHRIKTERDRKAGLLRGKRRQPRSPQPARAGPGP